MKISTILLFAAILLLPFGVFSQIYVSPAGKTDNNGSIESPTTLLKAINTITAGQTIYMRGGIYAMPSTIFITRDNSGRESNLKHIASYADETPVIDFSAQTETNENKGIVLDAAYWYFKGITIRKAGDNGMLLSGNNNTIDNCIFEKNRDSGLQISRYNDDYTTIVQWPSHNLILNCEAFDNKDAGAENADGFAAKLTSGEGNIFRGCISHNNIDDGWDLFTKNKTGPIGAVLFENCVAYNNGTLTNGTTTANGDKNGFKLGGQGIPVNHILRGCVAFGNGQHGFTDNNNMGAIEMTNNTSYNNEINGFAFRPGGNHLFRNNLSYKSVKDKNFGKDIGNSNVWWMKMSTNGRNPALVVSDEDFVSLTIPKVLKNADGSPNLGDFLALKSTSDLVDSGVQATGIEYSGSAPDIGAREFGLAQKIISTAKKHTPENANLSPTTYALSIMASPTQGGMIVVNPNKSTYKKGEIVTLTAMPETGYELISWSTGESTAVTTIAMTADTGIIANFGIKLTGTHTLRIEESGLGYCSYDGKIEINSSAKNRKVTNIIDAIGKGINYNIKAPKSGAYSIVFRYVNRGKSTIAKVKINGNDAVDLSFPITSSTTKFNITAPTTIKLTPGVNTIRLETIENLVFANIDWMEITGEAPTAVSCH